MSNNQGGITCALWCWGISFVGGILAAALLMLLGGWSFLQGVFGGFVLFLVAGALLSWILCRPLPAANSATADVASGSSDAGQSASSRAQVAGGAAAAGAATASAASASSDSSAAGSAEAASDTASSGTDSSGGDSAATGASEIKPSASLSGEAELAERKGEWRYEGGDGASDASKVAASGGGDASTASAAASTETVVAADSGAQDYDGDGVLEGTDEGTKPEMLSGPREGGADNLKEIKGIGPKLEQLVNSMGVYHFDQIANWTPDEVAWVNANLTGFKGRVSRDNWIDQAKILAAGGETEFSKKVEKGGVYDE